MIENSRISHDMLKGNRKRRGEKVKDLTRDILVAHTAATPSDLRVTAAGLPLVVTVIRRLVSLAALLRRCR